MIYAHFATHHPLTRQTGVTFRTFSYGGLDDGISTDLQVGSRGMAGRCGAVCPHLQTHALPAMRTAPDTGTGLRADAHPEDLSGGRPEQRADTQGTPRPVLTLPDTDWPPAPYHAPQPEPPDTDWPCGVYVAPQPVIIEPFPVGQRVYAVGCGRGVVIGTWRDWYQVRLEVNRGVVGLKVDRLKTA